GEKGVGQDKIVHGTSGTGGTPDARTTILLISERYTSLYRRPYAAQGNPREPEGAGVYSQPSKRCFPACGARFWCAGAQIARPAHVRPARGKLNGKQTPPQFRWRDVLPPQRCARGHCPRSATCQPDTGLNRPSHCSTTCGDARHKGIIMPLHPSRPALATALCLTSLPLLAQNSVPQLDTVVVTANRSPQILDDVVGDVTVVDREELQRSGADSVATILSRQPGIQITDNGGRQTPTGVMLRGANANHTLLLIDGMRVNSSVQGGANWSALDPAAIERIEILRGAASSPYGSDAIGGVVNIITRKGETDRPLSAWADLGVGSQQTVKAATGFAGAQAGWDYTLSASAADSEGHSTSSSAVAYGNHHADDDGYQQHTITGSLGYRWAPGQHIGLNIYNSYIDGEYDAGEWTHPAHALTRQQAYSLTSTNDITRTWQSVLRFGLSKESYEDRVWDTRFSSLQRVYNWQNNFQLGQDHTLAAYVERIEERPEHSAGMEVNERNTNAVGAVYTGRFGRHSLQASVRNDNISGYGNETTGGLGYDYALTDAWTLGAGANTGFHAPTFSDLYYPGSENPDLQPEKSRNVEA